MSAGRTGIVIRIGVRGDIEPSANILTDNLSVTHSVARKERIARPMKRLAALQMKDRRFMPDKARRQQNPLRAQFYLLISRQPTPEVFQPNVTVDLSAMPLV
jgi:hypothetical protein